MLQPIQYQETCQLVDHNYNLVCCLVQLGQTSREMLAAFFFSSTSNPQGLPNPMSDKSGSHCVFSRGLPVLENELLS